MSFFEGLIPLFGIVFTFGIPGLNYFLGNLYKA